MSREMSVTLAKRYIVDTIWRSANMEGIAITYLDTEGIFNGMEVTGYKVGEIITVVNLKHAWQFLLDTLDEPEEYNYICQLNKEVGNRLFDRSGYVRVLPVRIGGTDWVPSMPNEGFFRATLKSYLSIEDSEQRALMTMAYLMRTQAFIDGNKRTAMLTANHILIANGIGVLSVSVENQREFKTRILHMYETAETDALFDFVRTKCIDRAT